MMVCLNTEPKEFLLWFASLKNNYESDVIAKLWNSQSLKAAIHEGAWTGSNNWARNSPMPEQAVKSFY